MTLRPALFAFSAISMFCTGALAHDITIFPLEHEGKVKLDIFYGDPGDYQPIDKLHFVEITVIDAKGVKISFLRDVARAEDTKRAFVPDLRLGDWPSGTYVVSSRYDNGFFIHDGENRAFATTKEWFPNPIDSAHYQKFSKALFHLGPPSAGYDRVLGHRLEFVPLADPFALKEGALLPVKVLFDGLPLANHIVEIGDDTAASKGAAMRSDGKGVFNVPLSHKGFYRLAVDQRAPSKYPALYEYDDYTASLIFKR